MMDLPNRQITRKNPNVTTLMPNPNCSKLLKTCKLANKHNPSAKLDCRTLVSECKTIEAQYKLLKLLKTKDKRMSIDILIDEENPELQLIIPNKPREMHHTNAIFHNRLLKHPSLFYGSFNKQKSPVRSVGLNPYLVDCSTKEYTIKTTGNKDPRYFQMDIQVFDRTKKILHQLEERKLKAFINTNNNLLLLRGKKYSAAIAPIIYEEGNAEYNKKNPKGTGDMIIPFSKYQKYAKINRQKPCYPFIEKELEKYK